MPSDAGPRPLQADPPGGDFLHPGTNSVVKAKLSVGLIVIGNDPRPTSGGRDAPGAGRAQPPGDEKAPLDVDMSAPSSSGQNKVDASRLVLLSVANRSTSGGQAMVQSMTKHPVSRARALLRPRFHERTITRCSTPLIPIIATDRLAERVQDRLDIRPRDDSQGDGSLMTSRWQGRPVEPSYPAAAPSSGKPSPDCRTHHHRFGAPHGHRSSGRRPSWTEGRAWRLEDQVKR